MSSNALQRIVADTPVDWWTRRRLEALVRRARAGRLQYTFEHLLAKVSPIPPEILSLFLAELVEQKLARRVIRVESPTTGGGLGDFDSPAEVPPTVLDDTVDPPQEIPVSARLLRVIYVFPGREADD